MDEEQYKKILVDINNSRQQKKTEDCINLNNTYENIIRKMWIDAKKNLRKKKLKQLYGN